MVPVTPTTDLLKTPKPGLRPAPTVLAGPPRRPALATAASSPTAGRGEKAVSAEPGDMQVLTAEEVVAILRLDTLALRDPREALRHLVRQGKLNCLRAAPNKRSRMLFLRRHVNDCLAQMEQWGQQARV